MAASTSPLPPPQQTPLTPTDLLLLGAANATYGQQPHIAAGVAAASPDLTTAVTNTQAATQLVNIQNVIDNLKNESAKVQQNAWKGSDGPTQAALRSAGYKPPDPSPSIWHDVENAAKAPFRIAGDVLNTPVVRDVANAANAPLRVEQNAIRAGALMFGDPNRAAAEMGGSFTSRLTSPADWAHAWNITSAGQDYIDPVVRRQAFDKYGSATYNMAYDLATGKNPLAGLQPGTPQYDQAAEAMQHPDVRAATGLLNAGHLSAGRLAVGAGFIARHPEAGNAISGGIDALFDWFGDPLSRGGMALGNLNHARYLVQTPEDVERLASDTGRVGENVRAGFNRIASAVRANSMHGLMDVLPQSKFAAQELMAANADTEDKVLTYFKDKAKLAQVISGTPTNAVGNAGGILPHLSRLGAAKLASKEAFIKSVNWAADKGATTLEREVDPLEGAINPEDWEVDENDIYHAVATKQAVATSRHLTGTDRLIVGAGRLARAATRLVPQKLFFDAQAPDAANNLRDIGLGLGLPDRVVDDAVTKFAKDPDLGNKWKVYRSLMIEGGHVSGLDTTEGPWRDWFQRFESDGPGVVYAPNGGAQMQVDSKGAEVGWAKAHLSQGWSVPNFHDMYLRANKASITQRVTRAFNVEWMNKAMGYWRPLTLAHAGFAWRVGGEEALGFGLREGFGNYLRGVGAEIAAKQAERAAGRIADTTTQDLANAQAAGIWSRFAGHLPLSVQNAISTPKDLYTHYMADYVGRAFAKTGQKIAGRKVLDAINAHMQFDGDQLPRQLSAMHGGYDPNQLGEMAGNRYIKIDRGGGKLVYAELKPGGEFKLYHPSDNDFMHMWHHQLHMIASDDWAREALPTFEIRDGEYHHLTEQERVNKIADRLQSDPRWKDSYRSAANRRGQQVATGEIDERQAAVDHAVVIKSNVDAMMPSDATAEKWLRGEMLSKGKPPTLPLLGDEVNSKWLPDSVVGPELILHNTAWNLIHKGTNGLFTRFIGPQINWISRQPMYWFQYTKGREAYDGMAAIWRSEGMSEENVAQLVHENARDYAINNIVDYVHNPQLRSELSTVTRNLSPFWFAQEQFMKRWARTAIYSPAAIRKMALISAGIRHSGLTEKDPETGQEYFVYPASSVVQDVLTGFFTHIGIPSTIPVAAGMTGQMNALSPGLQRLGLPSVGPLVVLPLNAVKTLDPHMAKAVQKIEGPIAAQSGFLKALLPATVAHAVEVAVPSIDQSTYNSAYMQALQYMEASGHGMSYPATHQVGSQNIPNPTAGDYVQDGAQSYVYQPDGKWVLNSAATEQKILDRAKNWARIFMVTRAIYGFSAPAAPETQFDYSNMDGKLKTLMAKLPFNDALQVYLQQNPDATPYTVFQSSDTTGGFLPATKASMQFLDNNPALTSKYQDVATFFIPAADQTGNFDVNAYHEQLQEGFRQKKSPQTFYNDIIYAQAAKIYFNTENYKNTLLAQGGSKSQINKQWVEWEQGFMQANPVFAQQLSGSTGQLTRQQIMDNVGAAIRTGTAPVTAQTAAVAKLYDTYSYWRQLLSGSNTPNGTAVNAATALSLDEQFATWLGGYVQEYPGVQPLVDRAIRPDLSNALNTMAVQGNAVTI